LSVDELTASVGMASLFSLYPELDAQLNGFELNLRQAADGSWDYETWSSGDDAAEEPEEEAETLERLPFFGQVKVTGGSVLMHANNGLTEIRGMTADGGVEEGATLVKLDFKADLVPSEWLRASGALGENVGVEGDVSGDLAEGPKNAQWEFDMGLLNGDGRLALGGQVSPAVLLGLDASAADQQGLSIKLDAESLGLNARLMPLLGLLHPAFQSLSSLDSSGVGGLLNGELNLAFRGSLGDPSDLSGFLSSSLAALSGDGNLSIAGVKLGDTPMVQKMFDYLGMGGEDMQLDPLRFSIQEGRINYKDGWSWKLGGLETSFDGSVGLDGSLDLAWNAPVTDAVIQKYSFLRHMKGSMVGIPIRGSMTNPSFDFQQAAKSVGTSFVKDELLQQAGLEEMPDLDELKQLGLGKLGLGASSKDKADPKALFKQANELWDRGEKSEAAKLYSTLRSDHRATLVYTLNSSKIKKRAKYDG